MKSRPSQYFARIVQDSGFLARRLPKNVSLKTRRETPSSVSNSQRLSPDPRFQKRGIIRPVLRSPEAGDQRQDRRADPYFRFPKGTAPNFTICPKICKKST